MWGKRDLPQGPGLLCSISSSESVICWIHSYRLGGDFWSSVLGKGQRGAWRWAGRKAPPPLYLSSKPCARAARTALPAAAGEQGLAPVSEVSTC